MKILVLHIRGLSTGYIGCYGNDWIDTANMDRLASEGIVFDQHFADTMTSVPSSLSGYWHYPWLKDGQANAPRLQSILQDAGIACEFLPPIFPTKSADDDVLYFDPMLDSIDRALTKLLNQENFLLWADMPDLYPPWSPALDVMLHYFNPELSDEDEEEEPGPLLDPPNDPREYDSLRSRESLHLTYAAAISDFDNALGNLVKKLKDQGCYDDLCLAVTGDRGIALVEHQVLGDVPLLMHEEMIHLPLIIRLPEGKHACQRFSQLTQPVDLFPTMLTAFDIAILETAGKSLWPILKDPHSVHRPYLFLGDATSDAETLMLRNSDWALRFNKSSEQLNEPQLFQKPHDRWENNNVQQSYFDYCDQLTATLNTVYQTMTRTGPPEWPDFPSEDESEN